MNRRTSTHVDAQLRSGSVIERLRRRQAYPDADIAGVEAVSAEFGCEGGLTILYAILYARLDVRTAGRLKARACG